VPDDGDNRSERSAQVPCLGYSRRGIRRRTRQRSNLIMLGEFEYLLLSAATRLGVRPLMALQSGGRKKALQAPMRGRSAHTTWIAWRRRAS